MEIFCPNVEPGKGRIYKCLIEKDSELSNACKKRLAELRATGGECKDDIEKFCASVPHAQGRLAQCLSEHQGELSADCKTLVVPAKGTTASAAVPAVATPKAQEAAAPAVAKEAPRPAAPDAGTR